MKRVKKIALVLGIPFFLVVSLAAGDHYFEITKHIDIFVSVYKEVDAQYVDEVNHAKLMRKAIDGMLRELDPYTVFYSESEIEDYKFQQTGKYGGIGANVGRRGEEFVILEVYENYAAHEAGLLPGDIILAIDGKPLKTKTVRSLSPFLKGEPNTKVQLKVRRQGEQNPLEFVVSRDEVKVDNITHAQMLEDGLGYVKFSNFRQEAASEVRSKLEEFKKQDLSGLILDLRGNPGGLLHEAVQLVNLFVGRQKLVVSTKGKNENNNRPYVTRGNAYDKDLPVVVLIDGNSASASEIVSGALQDYDRAVVIGNNSFGKGLVQNVRPVSYNTQVKVTVSKYYIPSGRCIQKLDYGKKDDQGNPLPMPDSLKTEFATTNGRKVYDGVGIEPDIKIDDIEVSAFVKALIDDYKIFDFATHFQLKNESIPHASEFNLNDQIFGDFCDFINTEGFLFQTEAERSLSALKEDLESNQLAGDVARSIAAIEKGLDEAKKTLLEEHRGEIEELLRLEIVSRYYHRKGRAEASLRNDKDLQEAKRLLLNPQEYNEILAPA